MSLLRQRASWLAHPGSRVDHDTKCVRRLSSSSSLSWICPSSRWIDSVSLASFLGAAAAAAAAAQVALRLSKQLGGDLYQWWVVDSIVLQARAAALASAAGASSLQLLWRARARICRGDEPHGGPHKG